jgi:glycosyltransferase involved in cell wall biosynthesis
VKVGVVVQRYGADISGGAELHARYIAERLSPHAEVRVLTTCARDYLSWRNELPPGEERVNGIPVERFPVAAPRHLDRFWRQSTLVFTRRHSLHDELRWLELEGPTSRALVARLRRSAGEFDYVLLFSARYYHAYYGARVVADRAVLVPTAEREPSLGLALFGPIFRGVRAIMYNSFEERALIQAVSANHHVPGVVVGVGSKVPSEVSPERFRREFGIATPFVVYVGRIDENKGCAELFEYFLHHVEHDPRPLSLVLIGTPIIPIPDHPRIRHLGYVSDRVKFDAMAAAEALVMPSYFESLSMVALEAWALGRPVLANARCDVLVGQSIRSNGGLYCSDAEEFSATLQALLDRPSLARSLGENGRTYVARHYDWRVIERKYLDMFAQLERARAAGAASRPMEPLPGWWARRARTLRPASEVVDALPAGPAVAPRGAGARP